MEVKRMQLLMDIVFVIAVGIYTYQYILGLVRMKKKIIFPSTAEELEVIRKHPQKPLDSPANPKNKTGILVYSLLLLFIIFVFIYGKITETLDWTLYPLMFLPLMNGNNLYNIFAIQDEGILDGGRFIRWSKLKTYQFIPIDLNHKFYGYSPEVNDGFELKIQTAFFPISCIVTSIEMKEKLELLLSERIQPFKDNHY